MLSASDFISIITQVWRRTTCSHASAEAVALASWRCGLGLCINYGMCGVRMLPLLVLPPPPPSPAPAHYPSPELPLPVPPLRWLWAVQLHGGSAVLNEEELETHTIAAWKQEKLSLVSPQDAPHTPARRPLVFVRPCTPWLSIAGFSAPGVASGSSLGTP